ncbi:MAG: DoxX family protein [Crocinitomicaceae bacterium]|jgi:hypothetical protein|nr:DoxX family protein [Crocinitomicaceae bacterium]
MKTNKTTTIISWILIILPSLMLLMSAFMKLSGAQELVVAFQAMGLGKLLAAIGVIELIATALLLIPKTYKIGFLLINGYLGGAICMELAGSQFPVAAVLLSVLWIGVFLRDKNMFLASSPVSSEK